MSEKQTTQQEKEITVKVLAKIQAFEESGELVLPKNYIVANALKGAMLILNDTKDRAGNLALNVCTKTSIANALLKMCVEGLSPLKKQGYFIVYGDSLEWSRSYQGSLALAKRVGGVLDVVPGVVYQDDIFEFSVDTETGYKKIIKHEQKIENIDNSKIKGAYGVIIFADGRKDLEVMTIQDIKQAWSMGYANGNSKAHNNFTQEMSKKTLISRACKGPINSSNDFELPEGEEKERIEAEDIEHEVVEESAKTKIDFAEKKGTHGVIETNVKEEAPKKEKTSAINFPKAEEAEPGF